MSANGARRSWLLILQERIVELWRPDPAGQEPASERREGIGSLDADPLFPELRLDLTQVWDA